MIFLNFVNKVNCMKKDMIKNLVKINCEKMFPPKDSKSLLKYYEDFLEKVNDDYSLKLLNELSISNTPQISIRLKDCFLPSAYLWCYNENFYLKTPVKAYITENVEAVLDFIDEYFYE